MYIQRHSYVMFTSYLRHFVYLIKQDPQSQIEKNVLRTIIWHRIASFQNQLSALMITAKQCQDFCHSSDIKQDLRRNITYMERLK